MSRSGYDDDYDGDTPLGLYRQAVNNAAAGKRGQHLLNDILAAMDAMPEKRLIADDLEKDGAVCAIGAAGKLRGVDMAGLDPEDARGVARKFNIAECLAREIVYVNDEGPRNETPEERFVRVRQWLRKETGHSYDASFCWGNFCKGVFYGRSEWPSYSVWMVPGTVTDMERASL